jgi:hypothetical protein
VKRGRGIMNFFRTENIDVKIWNKNIFSLQSLASQGQIKEKYK